MVHERRPKSTIQDKIFLLSTEETANAPYGFEHILYENSYYVSDARLMKPTDYAKAIGAFVYGENEQRWLHSPGDWAISAANVFTIGFLNANGTAGNATFVNYSIRPALIIADSAVTSTTAGTTDSTTTSRPTLQPLPIHPIRQPLPIRPDTTTTACTYEATIMYPKKRTQRTRLKPQ
ncbi:MAG: DUF6273 domain-containing protein [Clostridiales bacterium]|jgi:hypothetical protein|nr:DUF6273 domain-containing protein [Clostridiales bacterium]